MHFTQPINRVSRVTKLILPYNEKCLKEKEFSINHKISFEMKELPLNH